MASLWCVVSAGTVSTNSGLGIEIGLLDHSGGGAAA
jgi:hypothetical protein